MLKTYGVLHEILIINVLLYDLTIFLLNVLVQCHHSSHIFIVSYYDSTEKFEVQLICYVWRLN